ARVECDQIRVRQLLVNLLHNAVKFTERGSVEVDITMLEDKDDAVRLRFAVRDTGISMATDQLERVFESFTQADGSSTRRHGGSGHSRGIYTPIVALAADALAGDRERCIEAGMDDFVTKPISSTLLASVVERWTGHGTAPLTKW